MILLSVQSITKHFGPEPVLAGITFDVRSGQRISLVGPNGTGKTTLLKIIAGQLDPDSGTVDLHRKVKIGFLEQQPEFDADATVWSVARSAMQELIHLAERAEQLAHDISIANEANQRRRLGEQFDQIQHELQQRDGYHLDHKIERILEGLGFSPSTFHQPVQQLSGGQQNRLLLVRLLLEEPELMLLDEPSNHLDFHATGWLEDYLVESRQSLIVVSHDRYFLDKVTDRTLELFRGTTDTYSGNYSAYQNQKKERLEVQRRTHDRQQIEITKLADFVRRNKYGQKHAQAEDRRKKLERIELVEEPREIVAPKMQFAEAARSGDIVMRIEHLSKAFDLPLFSDLSFDILRGERWGILGPNGSGKTTLLRCLLGEQTPDQGEVILGTGVKIGYFDQLLNCIDADSEVVDAIRPAHKEFVEQQRRDLLARFGLGGDIVFQRVSSLSGGEKNRVALAMLAASDANLLILDEPTNHLDLWARGALESAIKKFAGTVLFVSHDRYFLNRVADHLLVVEPNRFCVVEGNYDTYLRMAKRTETSASKEETNRKKASGNSAAPQKGKRGKPTQRKRQFPYRKVGELEAEISEHETSIQELHEALASPDVLRDGEQVKKVSRELQEQQQILATLYEHWEESLELN